MQSPVLCGCATAVRFPRAQRAPVPPHACRALRVPILAPNSARWEDWESTISAFFRCCSSVRQAPGRGTRRVLWAAAPCWATPAAELGRRQHGAGRERDRDAASPGSEGRRPAGRNGLGLSGGSAGPASFGPASSAPLSPAAAGSIKACRSRGRRARTRGGVKEEGWGASAAGTLKLPSPGRPLESLDGTHDAEAACGRCGAAERGTARGGGAGRGASGGRAAGLRRAAAGSGAAAERGAVPPDSPLRLCSS